MKQLIVFLAVTLNVTAAPKGDEPIKILCGGPSTMSALKPRMPEIEKFAGKPIEFKVTPIDSTLVAMSKGFVDGFLAAPIEELIPLVEKKGLKKVRSGDFQSVLIAKLVAKLAVHPDNPVKSLSDKQITGIVTGEITSWEPITGENIPVNVFLATDYVAIYNAVTKSYGGAEEKVTGKRVVNEDGLIRAIQQDKGAVGFFGRRIESNGFKPKYFVTAATANIFFHIRKDARPEVQKLFQYFQAQSPIRVE